jgi:transcriptional regulator with XRE-family HTH domain
MDLPGLRAARLNRLLTQAELAKRVNMTTASISRIETGTTKARISTVRRLAKALDVDPDELLSGTQQFDASQQKDWNR